MIWPVRLEGRMRELSWRYEVLHDLFPGEGGNAVGQVLHGQPYVSQSYSARAPRNSDAYGRKSKSALTLLRILI